MSPIDFKNKTILLGVSGSIAAYKAAELASTLVQGGASVHVVMTRNAVRFVQPLTFAALTGNRVHVDMFDETAVTDFDHITLTERADLLLIAPATANVIAKMATGIADDLLSATVLASRSLILIAPAMNTNMWTNAATVANILTLKNRGCRFVEPEAGRLACGTVGPGRMAGPEIILASVDAILKQKKDLAGLRVLVTAGATREPIDPVRFLSNRSSGKMGFALAEAARDRGARVVLLCGATHTSPPEGVEVVATETAEAMRDAAAERFPDTDVVISAAAIADFRPAHPQEQKLKKAEGPRLAIDLEPTPDLLVSLGPLKQHQILVGFAAETENLLEQAHEKLKRKNLDIIAANDVTQEGAGFGTETNIVTLIIRDGAPVVLPKLSKREVADRILDEVSALARTEPRP